jgi:anthranilate synthase, component II (EC 4.1.3.27)
MILVIDNYDSFTYNLVHLAGRETDDLEVVRNDDLTVADVAARDPDGILISPGPGIRRRPASRSRSSGSSARRPPSWASASGTRPSGRSTAGPSPRPTS